MNSKFNNSINKIISFFQSDEHKDIYELKILVDSLDSTFWLGKQFQLHQVELEGFYSKISEYLYDVREYIPGSG